MYLSKKLLGSFIFILTFFWGLTSQQIPHEEIIFPDHAIAGKDFAIHIYSNYNLEDVVLLGTAKTQIPHRISIGKQKDVQFINHYEIAVQAPNILDPLSLQLMLTWNNGIRRNVQVYDQILPIIEKDLTTFNPGHQGMAIFAASKKVVQIYPNPSQGEFLYLEFRDPENRPTMLKVYDIFGQLVDEMNLDEGRTIYRANRLKNGNYIFTFYGEHNIFSEKVKIATE